MNKTEFTVKPIGYVRIGEQGYYLEIEKEFRPALKEVEKFSHLHILFWCHLVDDQENRKTVECEQPYKKSPQSVGIFATRSPIRPNPIATTPVPVINIDQEKGIIIIPFLDAEENTPIIDIKPYTPCIDRIKDVKTPDWNSHWPQWYEDSADFDWEAEFVTAT